MNAFEWTMQGRMFIFTDEVAASVYVGAVSLFMIVSITAFD